MILIVQLFQSDEPTAIAQKNLQHFDHSFKAELHTASGTYFTDVFGDFSGEKRNITVVCKAGMMDVFEDVGISARKHQEIIFSEVCWQLVWYLSICLLFSI